MKITKPNINIITTLKYLNPIVIILIIIVLTFLLRFLYNNVYQTIIQAELITDLRKEISDEVLQKNKFDRIIENIRIKTQERDIGINKTKDPFQPLTKSESTPEE
jgi:cell division protein FtsL